MARDLGVTQFLDLGSGLPTADNVHQVAQRGNLTARVVYVDNDPIVLAHNAVELRLLWLVFHISTSRHAELCG
jgi:hypothetical protein